MENSSPLTDGLFPRTRWTLVAEVRAGGSDSARALDELCRLYWYPVYAYARRSGAAPADAEDLTQGFFAQLVHREKFARAEAAKGRLRSFLLNGLKHFRIDQHRRDSAQKRGGGVAPLSIEADRAEARYGREPADLEDPERLFERRWALTLLEEAFVRVETEYAAGGKRDIYLALRPFLTQPDQTDSHAAVAERLRMSAGAVQVAVHRLRKRYRSSLESVIAATLDDPAEMAAEFQHILQVLARP
jgi:RNA polymerase sigma-70 factor (ECF subfamily)